MHKPAPTVSVIIPTHNRAKLLGRAIESVREQTYHNLEIIVVDDNSTDNTEEVVKKFRDPRLTYIRHERNRGGSAARNTGIRAATSEYIAFLDDDDEWLESKTDQQLEAIKNFDAVLCASISKRKNKASRAYRKPIVDPRDLRKGYIFGGGASILLARSAVIKCNLFDPTLSCNQDWDLLVRLASQYRIAYISEPLVIYNDGGYKRITNEPIAMSVSQLEDRMRAVYKHEKFLGPYWFRYQIARRLLSYIRYRKKRLRHLMYSIRRCGVLPVLMVIQQTITRRVRGL